LIGISSAGAVYTAGRAFAIATRPLALFLANNFLQRDTAEDLAVAILASAVALAATAADPHREYYLRHFSEKPRAVGLSFYTYVVALAVTFAVGSAVVTGVSLRSTGSAALLAAAILYFASEKVADEQLRFKLFERDLAGWGGALVRRSLLQLAGLGALALVLRESTPAWAGVAALALGNVVVFVPRLPRLPVRRLLRGLLLRRLATSGMRLLRRNSALWTFALLSTGVGYVDRVLAMIADKAVLPLFMLVVMCFSIVQMAVDFYYVAPRRRDFLEQTVTVGGALSSRRLVATLAVGLLIGTACAVLVLAVSRNGADFPWAYALMIAALQTAMALVAIPQQILYWKDYLRQMLRLELVFWALFGTGAVAMWLVTGPSLGPLLGVAVVATFVRLALFTFAARSAQAA
jgi:hypothetical protein